MNGTIALNSELMQNKVFDYAERFKLYILLLLLASPQQAPADNTSTRPQVITSTSKLSTLSSLTPKQVRNALRALQKSGLIEVVTTHRNTTILF